MANFTPGPWIVDKHLDIRDKKSHVIAQVSHMPGKIGRKDVFNPKSMANARLIAAAPEMYAMLLEVKNVLQQYDCDEALSYLGLEELLTRIDGEVTNE